MPRFNRTGPLGFGPGTGWRLGPCDAGIGWRREIGRGFGRFWRFGPQRTKKEEKEMLEEEVGILEEKLKAIKAGISELKGSR